MAVFIDTSALYAALDADDDNHEMSVRTWRDLGESGEMLSTSNYVLIETIAVVGRRLGLQAVRDFQTQFVPLLEVHWVDESLHELAVAALLTASRRNLSLVDCVSFEIARRQRLGKVFAFDAHFGEQGFLCIP
ncbi:MAG: PIN domain-containing protein [Chloroflexota bacterium]|nr:MAG: PIN domain-containing protein [Chloroflexota bacterium]